MGYLTVSMDARQHSSIMPFRVRDHGWADHVSGAEEAIGGIVHVVEKVGASGEAGSAVGAAAHGIERCRDHAQKG